MSLLYKKQVTTDVSPSKPDYSVEETALQGMQDVQTIADKQKEFELKEQEKQQDYADNLIKSQALSIYKDTATLYPKNYEKFNEELTKNLEKVYSQIDDDNTKIRIMAETQIAGSNYVARVQKGTADKVNKQYKEAYVKKSLLQLDAAEAGFPSLFNSTDKNLSPVQQQEAKNQFLTAMIPVQKVYDERNKLDNNKEPFYSKDEIKHIEKVYNTIGRNSLLAYTDENLEDNRQGVISTYKDLQENKADYLENYNMSEKEYDKAVSDMGKIINKESTYAIMQTESLFSDKIESFEIKSGKVLNEETDMVDISETIYGLEQAKSNLVVSDKFYQDNMKQLLQADYYMDRKDVGMGDVQTEGYLFWKKEFPSVAQRTWARVDEFVPSDKETSEVILRRQKAKKIIEAKLHERGIDMRSVSVEDISKANSALDESTISVFHDLYPSSKNFTDDELLRPDTQSLIIREYEQNKNYYASLISTGVLKKNAKAIGSIINE